MTCGRRLPRYRTQVLVNAAVTGRSARSSANSKNSKVLRALMHRPDAKKTVCRGAGRVRGSYAGETNSLSGGKQRGNFGGAGGNRTHVLRFCRPLPYHLGTAPQSYSISKPCCTFSPEPRGHESKTHPC